MKPVPPSGASRRCASWRTRSCSSSTSPLAGSTAVRASIVETARKYLDGLSSEAGNDSGLLLDLAAAYERLGDIQGGTLGGNLGKVDDARRSYQRALDLYARLRVNRQSPPDVRRPLRAGAAYR